MNNKQMLLCVLAFCLTLYPAVARAQSEASDPMAPGAATSTFASDTTPVLVDGWEYNASGPVIVLPEGLTNEDLMQLITIENDTLFYQKMMSLSQEKNGLDTDLLLDMRSNYMKSKTNQGMLNYGVCKRIAEGADGCKYLKIGYPELYKECLNSDNAYWLLIVPEALKPNATRESFQKAGREICAALPENKGRPDSGDCADIVQKNLEVLRIVLFERDRKLCETVPDSGFKNYCLANFNRQMDFCEKSKDFVAPCLVHKQTFVSTMAISLRDLSLLPPLNRRIPLDALLARSFLDDRTCDDYLNLFASVAPSEESDDSGKKPEPESKEDASQ